MGTLCVVFPPEVVSFLSTTLPELCSLENVMTVLYILNISAYLKSH